MESQTNGRPLLAGGTAEQLNRMAAVGPSAKTFTPKQGQYSAYILYTRLHRRPPAEADIKEYFGVTPPSVHQMVLALGRAGFITTTGRRAQYRSPRRSELTRY
jgi:DNA-binding MarR family transcriptional regulator